MINASLLRNLVAICIFSFIISGNSYSQEVIAETLITAPTKQEIFESQLSRDFDMPTLEKENQRCIRCHQKKRLLKDIQAITTVGSHASDTFLNNCTACHGVKKDHPKNDNTIISYSIHASLTIFDQNQQCMNCHVEQKLRAADWTHDVHMTPIGCTSCHSIHKQTDPMANIKHTDRILMCIDCHGVGN